MQERLGGGAAKSDSEEKSGNSYFEFGTFDRKTESAFAQTS